MEIECLHLPDLHVGHPKVKPTLFYEHFHKYIFPELNDDLSILFISGDFFDTLLNMSNAAGFTAAIIINEIIEQAMLHKFYIRVLRGTLSHDRNQNQFFLTNKADLLDLNNSSIVKVFNTVSLEYLEPFGIYILYLPDDISTSKLDAIKNTLTDARINKVDLIVNHGYFSHMLPYGITPPHNTLSIAEIKPYVKGCVLNGHIHTASIKDNVLSGGSFERLNHGEEEAKGCYRIYYNPTTSKCRFKFIENKSAIMFKTIDISTSDPDSSKNRFVDLLDQCIQTRENDDVPINIRIITSDATLAASLMNYATHNFKNVYVTIKSLTSTEQIVENIDVSTQELPSITESNCPDLVYEFLQKSHQTCSKDDVMEVFNVIKQTR